MKVQAEHLDAIPGGMIELKPGQIIDRGSEGAYLVVKASSDSAHLQPYPGEATKDRIRVSRFTDPETLFGFDLPKILGIVNRKMKGQAMKLQPGDRIGLDGEQAIVYDVTESTARVIFRRRFETVEREQNEFLLVDKPRHSEDEAAQALENFLLATKLSSEELTKNTNEETEYEMKTKQKLAKAGKKLANPRGGLAAAAKGGKATPHEAKKTGDAAKGSSRGRLGSIFDFSVVRVVQAAGRAGATLESIFEVLKKHKINAKEGTVRGNFRKGVNGSEVGAPLTKAQLSEFTYETAAEKKAKAKEETEVAKPAGKKKTVKKKAGAKPEEGAPASESVESPAPSDGSVGGPEGESDSAQETL